MKIIHTIIILLLVFSSISSVYAVGETEPMTSTRTCNSCTSGAPELGSYVTWMNEIIAVLKSVPNNDSGQIAGQGYNIATKKSYSNTWSQYSQSAILDITNQSPGIKSDMRILNTLHTSLDTVILTLINRKNQRTTNVDSATLSKITSIIAKQVGPNKFLSGSSSLPTTMTYQQLASSLMDLHRQVAQLPKSSSGYTISRQGYQGNQTTINKLISYYECGQIITTCRKERTILKQTASSVKGYRKSIVQARGQIKKVTSSQYWTLMTTKDEKGRITNIEDGYGASLFEKNYPDNEYSMLFDRLRIGGSRKKSTKAILSKNEAIGAQKQAKEKELSNTIAAKKAAKGGSVSISPTIVEPDTSASVANYQKGDIAILVARINAATDRNLADRIETQKYTLVADSRQITYQIPQLTKQIYDTIVIVKQSAKIVRNKCVEHCSNLEGECGPVI